VCHSEDRGTTELVLICVPPHCVFIPRILDDLRGFNIFLRKEGSGFSFNNSIKADIRGEIQYGLEKYRHQRVSIQG
jgi:hypothetical protein